MTVETNRIQTIAKLVPRVFHLLQGMKDLRNDVHACLLWPSKDNTEMNQQPNYTQIDLAPLKCFNCAKIPRNR